LNIANPETDGGCFLAILMGGIDYKVFSGVPKDALKSINHGRYKVKYA